jgi:hypothetical protein
MTFLDSTDTIAVSAEIPDNTAFFLSAALIRYSAKVGKNN